MRRMMSLWNIPERWMLLSTVLFGFT
jgi:hypothetical protein